MTTDSIPWFRDLYNEVQDYKRHTPFHDVLTPWIQRARVAIVDLSRFKSPEVFNSEDQDAQFTKSNLYALSRTNDLLIAPFQPSQFHERPHNLSRWEYETFFEEIGFTVTESNLFSPLHDEIVKVEQSADVDEPVQLYERFWPELMLGDMVFSRSGAGVLGGTNNVAKNIAQQSTLYFTHRRYGRKTNDLSMGWGHNSQWRTDFRRDYQFGTKCIYNADGTNLLTLDADPSEDSNRLTVAERIELCKHRCFVVTAKEDHDLWPFDDRYEETGS